MVVREVAIPMRRESGPVGSALRLVEAEHHEYDDRCEQEREHEGNVELELARSEVALRAHNDSSPTRHRYTNTPARMNTIRSTDIAEPNGQLLPLLNWSYTVLPNIWVRTPPSSCGVTKSPTAGMNTCRMPAMSPGDTVGMITRNSGESLPWPR